MIQQIDISNFRSIKNQSIPLKKINVLYGPNGSGKSSVMYAPYVFRNFCRNPNQRLDSLFNLGFINLGDFDNVVRESKEDIRISFKADLTKALSNILTLENYDYQYTLVLTDILESSVEFEFDNMMKSHLHISLPYTLNSKRAIGYQNNFIHLSWNGIIFEGSHTSYKVAQSFNQVFEEIKNIELVSVKRGFFSPIFSTELSTEESHFALNIRNQERDFESKIDHYFKQVFGKTFRFVAIPGSTSFYLRTQNQKGQTTDLVNEGFGINQTIYMLINLLKRSTSLAFIEEPEIHLHPTAQNALMDVFVEIIKNEGKQIFISTHSENVVTSLLTKISKGELDVNEVQFYLATKENDETKIIPQTVNDKGQIEGGLLSFMQTELENFRSILGLNG